MQGSFEEKGRDEVSFKALVKVRVHMLLHAIFKKGGVDVKCGFWIKHSNALKMKQNKFYLLVNFFWSA